MQLTSPALFENLPAVLLAIIAVFNQFVSRGHGKGQLSGHITHLVIAMSSLLLPLTLQRISHKIGIGRVEKHLDVLSAVILWEESHHSLLQSFHLDPAPDLITDWRNLFTGDLSALLLHKHSALSVLCSRQTVCGEPVMQNGLITYEQRCAQGKFQLKLRGAIL